MPLTAILVPVKRFEEAKLRQASLLRPQERISLAQSMLLDVFRALKRVQSAASIVVVTNDRWAAGQACSRGWQVIVEREQVSESRSVDEASAQLKGCGIERILRLPADIPLLRTEDVESVLASQSVPCGAVIVPSRDGRGTNALLRKPPDVFPSRFGPDSFRMHCREAARARVPLKLLRNSRIELDLDEPSDLMVFCERGKGTLTGKLVSKLKLAQRMDAEFDVSP